MSSLRDPRNLEKFHSTYSTLIGQVETLCKQWKGSTSALYRNLSYDFSAITQSIHYNFDSNHHALAFQAAGDKHRAGQIVGVISSTGKGVFVYKPRSIDLEFHYFQFLHWINTKLSQQYFYIPSLIPKMDYGYMEFIDREPCKDIQEIRQFFKNQGRQLAVFYLLRASDMHWENVIAKGTSPVSIDLETLLTPELSLDSAFNSNPAYDELIDSVLQTSFLPTISSVGLDSRSADRSGIAGASTQATSVPVPALELDEFGNPIVINRIRTIEPPRLSWRLQQMRRWSHDEREDESIFA